MSSFPRFESAPADPAPLGRPLEFPFSKRTAKNVFLKSAMSERLASFDETDIAARGIPGTELETLYRTWGEGGWGQILTGNVMIDPAHLEAANNMIIPADAPFEGPRFEAFKRLAAGAKAHGSLILAQVSHPGRQVSDDVQKHPISASAVQLVAASMGKTYAVPRAATEEDIKSITEGFAHAAEYLEKAGFDGMQLHGAHGYLLAQFLSPTTNQRTDKYGGSLQNRMRLSLEVAAAVKARVSESFILGMKVNSVEFQDKGFTPDEAVLLCTALEGAGIDYVETSGGTYEQSGFVYKKESTRKRESYFVEFAEEIAKAVTKMKVYSTGGFKTAAGMVAALEGIDGIGLARSSTQEPDIASKLVEGKVSSVSKPAYAEDQMFISLVGSGTQIRQISNGQAPMDLTNPEGVQAVLSMLAQRQ
jgi:2,4-dienoyl-CoA reductase-like NADH-dependent reductase (Old Yellow Enzyme family)